jgi:hypothetical protein
MAFIFWLPVWQKRINRFNKNIEQPYSSFIAALCAKEASTQLVNAS